MIRLEKIKETSTPTGNFYKQGGNSFGATGVLGLTDNFPLNIITNNQAYFTFNETGTLTAQGSANETLIDLNNQSSPAGLFHMYIGIGKTSGTYPANHGYISFAKADTSTALGIEFRPSSTLNAPGDFFFRNSTRLEFLYNGMQELRSGKASNSAGTVWGFGGRPNTDTGGYTPTSGTLDFLLVPYSFSGNLQFQPTSGTAIWNTINVDPIINQTGGANGMTTGIKIAPTLTAAADWRGIYNTATTGYFIYSEDGASNLLPTLNLAGSTLESVFNVNNKVAGLAQTTHLFTGIGTGTVMTLNAPFISAGTTLANSNGFIQFTNNASVGVEFQAAPDGTYTGDMYRFSGAGSKTGNNYNNTTGSMNWINLPSTMVFNPATGNGALNMLNISPTINQTGTASGITRGIRISPTLTAAADWRAIENLSNTGHFVYASGTATSWHRGQYQIGGLTGTTAPTLDASAILQLVSNTQGFLPPRMTNAQRLAISSPTDGLIVYCTDATAGFYGRVGGAWKQFTLI